MTRLCLLAGPLFYLDARVDMRQFRQQTDGSLVVRLGQWNLLLNERKLHHFFEELVEMCDRILDNRKTQVTNTRRLRVALL